MLPRWAIYLGRVSFGLYVYHEFTLDLVSKLEIGHRLSQVARNHVLRIILSGGIDAVLALALTIVLAHYSYRYFETPFLNLKKRYTVIPSQPGDTGRV